jgi:ATP-dependent protease ClpP protease subunit
MQITHQNSVAEPADNITLFTGESFLDDDLVVTGIVTADKASMFATSVIDLERDGSVSRIPIILQNCQATFSEIETLVDILQWADKTISTTCYGIISGAALLLMTSATCGLRFIHSDSMIQVNATWFSSSDNADSGFSTYDGREDVMQYIRQSVKGIKPQTVHRMLYSPVDTWLTAEEAVSIGFADYMFE